MSDHLPECECYGRNHGGCALCICDRLRAREQRVTERWESLRGWGESYAYKTGSDNGFDVGYLAGINAAREAVDRLASDMANWSSAETAAATEATPDLTADQWMWAQRGVHRALAAIEALRLPPLPTAHYDPAAKDNRP